MTPLMSLPVMRPFLGLFLTFLAVLFGLFTGIIIKKTGTEVGIVTTLFYRFLFSIPLLCAYALYMRGSQFLQINQTRTLAMRIIIGGSGIIFWFLSIRNMPFGQATALFQSAVIFVTIFSPLLLGEKIGIYRWSAVITGLFGVFIVTDPFLAKSPITLCLVFARRCLAPLCRSSFAALAVAMHRPVWHFGIMELAQSSWGLLL